MIVLNEIAGFVSDIFILSVSELAGYGLRQPQCSAMTSLAAISPASFD